MCFKEVCIGDGNLNGSGFMVIGCSYGVFFTSLLVNISLICQKIFFDVGAAISCTIPFWISFAISLLCIIIGCDMHKYFDDNVDKYFFRKSIYFGVWVTSLIGCIVYVIQISALELEPLMFLFCVPFALLFSVFFLLYTGCCFHL